MFVIYCTPPPRDLAPPPGFFCVLIVPTVGSGGAGGEGGGVEAWEEGASPLLSSALCATGVYMSAADVERGLREKESEAGKLFRLIPATPTPRTTTTTTSALPRFH